MLSLRFIQVCIFFKHIDKITQSKYFINKTLKVLESYL